VKRDGNCFKYHCSKFPDDPYKEENVLGRRIRRHHLPTEACNHNDEVIASYCSLIPKHIFTFLLKT
jgi:hypothetical protein